MSPKMFRLLLVAMWIVDIASFALEVAASHLLPADLQYYDEQQWSDLVTREIFFLTLALAVLLGFVAVLVTNIGLYFFKPWAKKLLPWTMIAVFVLILFLPPTVEHSLVTALSYLSSALYGAVFALVYFSPLAERFESPPRL